MKRNNTILYISIACIVIFVAVFAFSMRSCGSTSDNDDAETTEKIDTLPVMLMRIQQCSRINTAEVKVHKIITHSDQPRIQGKILGKELSLDIPSGKRKVAIPLYATVVASIDLSKMTAEDIQRDGENIEVFLPQPEVVITETHIDHDGIKQYVAFTRSNFSDEELQNFERQGRDAISKDITKLNIEKTARESAARQVIPIIQMLGYKPENITISFRYGNGHNKIIRKDR